MSLQERISVELLQENVGVVNTIKGNSTRKVFGSSKKGNALADVKNTLYLKQNAQLQSTSKKPQNVPVETLKPELNKTTGGSVLEVSSGTESVTHTDVAVTDEIYVDVDDCSYCVNGDDYDIMADYMLPQYLRLSDEDIDRICLDPNPKSRNAPPSPEFDIDDWYKKQYTPMSPPYLGPIYDDFSPIKLPSKFYDHGEILPVYE